MAMPVSFPSKPKRKGKENGHTVTDLVGPLLEGLRVIFGRLANFFTGLVVLFTFPIAPAYGYLT